MQVTQAPTVSDEIVAAFARLVPQLSSSARVPTREELDAIVFSPATSLLLARDDEGSIIGSLTLVIFRTPTGVRAWIEDVVVDESARGQGVGGALVEEAARLASAAKARTLDLTSRPARGAANSLYEKAGFKLRDTNVYRYEPG
ncbi:MAG TPA: GNAT family N-acetyltransferase [Gaiellaceae bacterium]